MSTDENASNRLVQVSLEVLYNPERLLTAIRFDFARRHHIPADQIYFEGIVCQSVQEVSTSGEMESGNVFCLLNLCLQGVNWDYER